MNQEVLYGLLAAVKRLTGVEDPARGAYNVTVDQRTEIDDILLKGKEVDLAAIEYQHGLLEYQGRQVLLYIPDQGRAISKVLGGKPSMGKKFHVANCRTLDRMREQNRFERYIAINNLSGSFEVVGTDEVGVDRRGMARLQVCKDCLSKLNYKNARRSTKARAEICNNFDIPEFFETYSTFFPNMPSRSVVSEGYGVYPRDWEKISYGVRAGAGWACQSCQVDLSNHRSLLHAHHIDGQKHNNVQSNLRALCIDCHRRQPLHHSMVVRQKDMETITRLRRQRVGNIVVDWESAFALTDTALHGAMYVARDAGWPPPEIGREFPARDGGTVQTGAAWPTEKEAIAVDWALAKGGGGWYVSSPQNLIERLS